MPEQQEQKSYHSIRQEYHLNENDCSLIHAIIARGDIYCGVKREDMNPHQFLDEFESQARRMAESRKRSS